MSESCQARDVLQAQTGDPRVTVHALSESVFCPRAAILGVERGIEEELAEEDFPRWDYVPFYFLEFQLAQRLKREFVILFLSVLSTVVCGLAMVWVYRRNAGWWPLLPGGLCVLSIINVASTVRLILVLSRQWLAQNAAVPKEPPCDLTTEMPINWWELRKAGFEPLRYEEALIDEAANLTGKPWRVLRKGDLRIPVIRVANDDASVYPQHRARVAAHCHLLTACEGGQSPYGIVLPRRGYDGRAIPNSAENADAFRNALVGFRRVLRSPESPPPASPGHCAACPCGYPRAYRPGQTEHQLQGINLPIFPARDGDGRIYHSLCGDRFRWIPPHARSLERELTAP